jgi:alpha-glucosidase (family GH31 glycosyl hydrolase)
MRPINHIVSEQYSVIKNAVPSRKSQKSRSNESLVVILAENLPAGHHQLIERVGQPARLPPIELFTQPTWTTWARYKIAIDQATVLKFAREIDEHGYPHHVMEIDDIWQTHYGDLEFAPDRFPDPRGLIDQLHAQGFKVTVWVIPFINPDAEAFQVGAAKGYLVQTTAGDPYLVKWWQGEGALLDVTNPAAFDWFLQRLRSLQQRTGLDGFKFDAGESVFLPKDAVWYAKINGEDSHVNAYTHHYVSFVAQHFGLTEVRSGWFNQSAPIFFRQWDKTSDWSYANGLKSVITGLLSLTLTGYPFILPDMIGGNAYGEQPNAELLIRWTQLTALLPAMQFSLAPWDLGEECDRTCRRYVEFHSEFASEILRVAEEAVRTGAPIIRPISWLAPDDERALLCDDEYLLGADVLVAPVVEAGQRARDIYLPPGLWRDRWSEQVIAGPIVLRAYPAPLDTLPIFRRQATACSE